MKKGEVAEKGTHNSLLEQGGVYAELVKTQISAEEQVE
jgi:ABC-type multidrug transport system fused ATPase/permease subunit